MVAPTPEQSKWGRLTGISRRGLMLAGAAWGIVAWLIDSVVDYTTGPEGYTFAEMVLTPPLHAVFARSMLFVAILGFAWVCGVLVERLQQRMERDEYLNSILRAVREVNQHIVRERDEQRLLDGACRELASTRQYRACWIALFDEEGDFDRLHQHGLSSPEGFEEQLAAGGRAWCMAASDDDASPGLIPHESEGCADCPLRTGVAGDGCIVAPMRRDDRIHGYLGVIVPSTYPHMEDECDLIFEMASDIGLGLATIRATDRLQHSEERFRTLFHHSSDAIFIYDMDGAFTEVNETACERYGYDRDELLEMAPQQLRAPGHAEGVPEKIDQIREAGRVMFESAHITREGEIVPVEKNAQLIEYEGEPHILSVARDISERREAQRMYQTVFETGTTALAIIENDGILSLVNRRFEELSGYPREEVEGKKAFMDFTTVESGQWMVRYHRQRREGKQPPQEYEFDFVDRGGNIRRVLVSVGVIPGTDQSVASLLDLTEHKQTEASLRRAYQIVNRSPAVAFRWANEEGWPVEFVSENVEEMFGYAVDRFLSGEVTYADIVHPDDLDGLLGELTKASSSGDRNELVHDSYRIVTADGRVRWVDDRTSVHRDQSGRITHCEGIVLDVTRRMEAEAAMRELSRFREAIIDQANTAVVVFDTDLTAIVWNRAAAEMTGYTARDTVGQGAWNRVFPHEEVVEEVQETLRSILREGTTVEGLETPVTPPAGEELVLSWYARRLEDEHGEPIGVVGIGHDVTEQTMLEERLRQGQRMEAIGRLAGGVAHDFNNIITAIIGNVQLLETQLDADVASRYLGEIRAASERAARLTEQLLAFGRRQRMEPEVFELNELIHDLEPMFSSVTREDVRLQTNLQSGPEPVKADLSQIEQIVINMVVNARDAMPEGGTVTLETSHVELDETRADGLVTGGPGAYAVLSVTDTGVGMSEETRERIFEPFFTTKDEGRGTGLGLATVYGIVQQSGGGIEVQSAPGEGATFRVYLPLAGDYVDTPEEETPQPQELEGGETILVVEDEDQVREFVTSMLVTHGYTVLRAASGEEAIGVAATHEGHIDLVVTDIVMPGIAGTELADRLRGSRPQLRVLYMSGYAEQPLPGGAAYLQKPFASADLLRAVRRLLEGRKEEP